MKLFFPSFVCKDGLIDNCVKVKKKKYIGSFLVVGCVSGMVLVVGSGTGRWAVVVG